MATYPECIQLSEHCSFCNTGESFPGCSNLNDGTQPCSAYCDSGCNTNCLTAQGYCNRNRQYIKNHDDVGPYPGVTISKDTYIKDYWTVEFWNSLITKLNTAGVTGIFREDKDPVPHDFVSSGDPITADLYNAVRDTLVNNFHVSNTLEYRRVQKDELITATLANAIQTAYNSATFDALICDLCNVGDQHYDGSSCTCNCSCTCSCPCACSCSCPCPCSCSCPCPCDCGCSCSGCSCSGCSCSCSSPAPSGGSTTS